MPTQYYEHKLNTEVAKGQNEKWFVRPHHVQTLTEHGNSLRDNLIDTNYHTYYDKGRDGILDHTDHLVPEDREEMIRQIETRITMLSSGNVSGAPRCENDLGLSQQFMHKLQFPEKTTQDKRNEFIQSLEDTLSELKSQKSVVLRGRPNQQTNPAALLPYPNRCSLSTHS